MLMTTRSEWRSGWTLLLAAAMGVGLSSAPIYSLGVFMAPLQHQFGWSRAEIALGQGMMSLVVAVGSPLAGLILDRYGARLLALFGTALICTMVAALSLLNGSLALYFGIWALIATGVAFASTMIWLRPVIDRFSSERGLALSLALCGSNVAGTVAPLFCALMIARFGWRRGYIGLGALMFLTSFPLAFAFFYDARDVRRGKTVTTLTKAVAPVKIAEGMTFDEAARSRNFWLMGLSFFLAGGGITAFIVHFVPMEIDRGLSALLAASAISGLSIAAIVGRLIAGFLMDKLFAPWIAAVALMLPVPASLILLFAIPSYETALFSAILVGLSTGAEFNMISFLTARYFGMRSYGVICGAMFGAFTAGSVFTPPLTGILYAAYGDYRLALIFLGLSFTIAAVAMIFCTSYPKTKQLGTAV